MLTQEDKDYILREFPNIKLSYETIAHKKVYNCELILAIPEGTKCFVWFTLFNDKYVCLLFELENNKKKEIKHIRIINTSFSKSLCYGTILYGTLFNHMNHSFFSIEDVFLYKNKDLSRDNWANKWNTITNILKHDITQASYNKHFVVFGLPVMAESNDIMERILKTDITYNIHSLQYYQSQRKNSYLVLPLHRFNANTHIATINTLTVSTPKEMKHVKETKEMKETNVMKGINETKEIERTLRYIVLEVRPDIQNDIYHLSCLHGISCGIACIPDYKTSKMMNALFRNIKENEDLDKLEESDDETEFENANLDKFVHLDKFYYMKCQYNKRFKKWTPIEIADTKSKLSTSEDTDIFIKKLFGNMDKQKYLKR